MNIVQRDFITPRLRIKSVDFVMLVCLCISAFGSVALAADHPHAKKCDAKIGVSVPAFSCQKDGQIVPKSITSGTCKKPEDLYARCVFNSTLGRLSQGKDNKGVDIIFSCRKEPKSGENYEKDKSNTYYDIAVIQHNRETGDTCFYQHLGETKIDKIPAPSSKEGAKFWNESTKYCTSCHSNGPFVRSPNYAQVYADAAKTDRLLPDEDDISDKKYNVLHDHYKMVAFDSGKSSANECIACHNIGAYQAKKGGKFRLGQVNQLAAGDVKSLRDSVANPHPSPTKSGYHDYMVVDNYAVTDRKTAIAELAKLEKLLADYNSCLKSPPSGGCKLKQPK